MIYHLPIKIMGTPAAGADKETALLLYTHHPHISVRPHPEVRSQPVPYPLISRDERTEIAGVTVPLHQDRGLVFLGDKKTHFDTPKFIWFAGNFNQRLKRPFSP